MDFSNSDTQRPTAGEGSIDPDRLCRPTTSIITPVLPASPGQALGQRRSVRKAQSILGPQVQAAMYAYPHGFMRRSLAPTLGPILGYLLLRNAPLSALPNLVLLSLDGSYLYLHEIALFKKPRELGRWRLGSYVAVAANTGWMGIVTLQLDGLGTVELETPIHIGGRANLAVMNLVVGLGQTTVRSVATNPA